PTPGIAVEFGQDDAVELEGFVKRLRAINRVLTGHRVANQVDLIRPNLPIDLLQLVHRHFVDVQPAGGIENDRVEKGALGEVDGVAADIHRSGRTFAMDGNINLGADDLDLLDRGG